MWPTPNASDWKGPGNQRGEGKARPECDDDLPSRVIRRLWPTPGARLGMQRGPQAKRYANPERSNDLDDAVAWNLKQLGIEGVSTQLNPAWVEALMGFPRDWTVIRGHSPGGTTSGLPESGSETSPGQQTECQTASIGSGYSETQSSPPSESTPDASFEQEQNMASPSRKGSSQDDNKQIVRVLGESDQPANSTDEKPLAPDIHPDRTRQFRSVNLSRMRTEWSSKDDVIIMEEIKLRAEKLLKERFAAAFSLRDRIQLCVRSLGPDNQTWETHEDGTIAEDWTQLRDEQRDDFLYTISVNLFEWEMAAVEMWREAMIAKAQWEQAFARGYLSPEGRYTIDDRTQAGHYDSDQERYHAIFLSSLSRGADAIVRSMTFLANTLERTRR